MCHFVWGRSGGNGIIKKNICTILYAGEVEGMVGKKL